MRKGYEKRFENFETMAKTGDTLLFVRVVATASELGRAYELTQVAWKRLIYIIRFNWIEWDLYNGL